MSERSSRYNRFYGLSGSQSPFPARHREFLTQVLPKSGYTRTHRAALLDGTQFWRTLDQSQILGDGETYGHLGCVNALSWSHDGSQLVSGSDDARLCIWEVDDATAPTPETPHPLRLKETIQTAHRANIFSAKFLPHANHPIIASVAGDRRVMVYDVERLGRTSTHLNELDGQTGPGVREILCHTDRVKRISTEDNPHVFLTVSEDGESLRHRALGSLPQTLKLPHTGTVRQHDLRTRHRCRPNPYAGPGTNCPLPLLEAPGGIELYSLSVSKLNPYLFTVAGTSKYAYLQDRRMTKQIAEEWSHRADEDARVQCVRRFGVRPTSSTEHRNELAQTWMEPQHITAVRMSPDVAEDLIVSFSGYGVALFSIHDNPGDNMSQTERAIDTTTRMGLPSLGSVAQPTSPLEDTATSLAPEQAGKSSHSAGPISHVAVDSPDVEFGSDMELSDNDPDLRDPPRRLVGVTAEDLLASRSDDMDTGLDMDDEDDDDEEWGPRDYDAADADEVLHDSPWFSIPIVFPRRVFTGARNIDTVKDVAFGGSRSDKICSGSDDGNWFMWDKATGRMEGIWHGDDSVVNVVEQHPSLPLFAVSGIDNTVKVFAPLHQTPSNSKRRDFDADNIISKNTAPKPARIGVSMREYRALIAQRLAVTLGREGEGDDEVDTGDCRLQ